MIAIKIERNKIVVQVLSVDCKLENEVPFDRLLTFFGEFCKVFEDQIRV